MFITRDQPYFVREPATGVLKDQVIAIMINIISLVKPIGGDKGTGIS